MKKVIPPRVDRYEFWGSPPPEPSPRLGYWVEQIKAGWRRNKRVSKMGYDDSAEFFGVYIWEYLNVLYPLLKEENEQSANNNA